MEEFAAYMRVLLEKRRRQPAKGLVSSLLKAVPDQISVEEVVAMVMVLVSAGHETTSHLIGNGVLALLQHPEQRETLRRHPELIGRAVEERLRYDSPVQQNARVVQEDMVEVGGHRLCRGETVIVLQGAANRDPRRFTDPDAFRVARSPNPHIAFGRGIHACLGAPLARLEGRVVLEALTARLRDPCLSVAADDLEYMDSSLFRGLRSLPVTFEDA
jgi:cytochrome P450